MRTVIACYSPLLLPSVFKPSLVPSADLAGALQQQVLSGSSGERSPDQVSRNVDHLVYTDAYVHVK